MVEHQFGMLNSLDEDNAVAVDELAASAGIPLGPQNDDAVLGDEAAGQPFGSESDLVPELQEDKLEPEPEPEQSVLPDLDAADWMSKLNSDEVFNGPNGPAPRLHGLRRLARPFVIREESRVNSLTVVPREYTREVETKNGEGHVMSCSTVVGQHYFPMASVTFFVTLQDGRVFSDSADAYYPSIGGDEAGAVAMHPTAVASARAEARCLRKVLGIREHAAEELVDKDPGVELTPDDDSPIKPEQSKLIDKILRSLELSLAELLEQVTTREVFSVDDLRTGEARKALRLLNDLKKKNKKKGGKKS